MRASHNEQLLRLLIDRGLLDSREIAVIPGGGLDDTLDARARRWGPQLGALVAAGRLDEMMLEAVARELDIEPRASGPKEGLGPFEMIRMLGEGAMGQVYLARDQRLGRQVALKLLAKDTDKYVARSLREARAQARVTHDSVCQVYEVGRLEGRAFIAMRFVDGPSLAAAAGELSLVEKVQVARDLALALHEAHRQGVTHRDIKPTNALLERLPNGRLRPVLTDFGLAHDSLREGATTTAGLIGTPAFMSPEQARGETRIIDRRSDVYSLGATLYFLLVGQPPLTCENIFQLMIKVQEEPPAPPRRIVPGLPEDLEVITLKCLAKDAADRYQTAQDLAEDLSRHIRGEPILGRRLGLLRRASIVVRRSPRVTAIGAVLGIVVMLLTGAAVRSASEARSQGERARQQAELGRRLGREIEQMEWLLRAEQMLPLHDIGPAKARVRARLAAMRGLLRGDSSDRPILHALGRGHLALGELGAARDALEAALALGEDDPDLRWALGLTMVKQYDAALSAAQRMGGPTWSAARRATLDREYLQPAREHLERGRGTQLAPEDLLEALLAYQRGDRVRALAKAREAAREHPLAYDARVLAGQILHGWAIGRAEAGDHVAADALFGAAIAAYEDAARVGRSDSATYAALAEAWIRRRETAFNAAAPSPDYFIAAALHAADRAIASAPEEAAGHRSKAFAYLIAFSRLEARPPELVIDRTAAHARAALARDPSDVLALDALGGALLLWATRIEGLDPTPLLRAAAASFAQAQRLSPGFPWAANDLGVTWAAEAFDRWWLGLDPTFAADRALEAFDLAVRLDPGYAYPPHNAVKVCSLLAEWHVSRGTWDVGLWQRVEGYRAEANRRGAIMGFDENLGAVYLARLRHAVAGGAEAPPAAEELEAILGAAAERSPEIIAIEADRASLMAEHDLGRGAAPARWLEIGRRAVRQCLVLDPASLHCMLSDIRLGWTAAAAGDRAALQVALGVAQRTLGLHRRSARAHQALAETYRRVAAAGRSPTDAVVAGLAAAAGALALAPDLAEAHATRGGLELLAAASARDVADRRAAAERALAAYERAVGLNPLLGRHLEAARREALRRARL